MPGTLFATSTGKNLSWELTSITGLRLSGLTKCVLIGAKMVEAEPYALMTKPVTIPLFSGNHSQAHIIVVKNMKPYPTGYITAQKMTKVHQSSVRLQMKMETNIINEPNESKIFG